MASAIQTPSPETGDRLKASIKAPQKAIAIPSVRPRDARSSPKRQAST
jgi:hypothetical protein